LQQSIAILQGALLASSAIHIVPSDGGVPLAVTPQILDIYLTTGELPQHVMRAAADSNVILMDGTRAMPIAATAQGASVIILLLSKIPLWPLFALASIIFLIIIATSITPTKNSLTHSVFDRQSLVLAAILYIGFFCAFVITLISIAGCIVVFPFTVFLAALLWKLPDFRSMATSRRLALLLITGLLLCQVAAQTFWSFSTLTAPQGALLKALFLTSFLGTIIMTLLPLYIWYKIAQVRKNEEYLPNWQGWMTGTLAFLGTMAFLAPIVDLPISTRPLIISLCMFAICIVMGFFDITRRIAMLIPFGFALLFLATGVYLSFAGSLANFANIVFGLSQYEYMALPMSILLGLTTLFFYGAGLLGFFYEIWRD
jgi:hypothetical protein